MKATQAQLIQSEKMASLGQLTAGIALEIKNPLNFINNFSEIIVELAEEISEELADHRSEPLEAVEDDLRGMLAEIETLAQRILKHGRRTDGIVKAMLQHSRGASGQRESFSLNRLLDEYVNLGVHGMRAQHADFDASVQRDFDEAVGNVEGIPQELGQVFVNLLNNAYYAVLDKQHEAGDDAYEPTVTISTRALERAVEVRVADNGPGIPPELRKKIFEPFFTTKPTGSGTGLGLSLSYDIVTQGHGGTMLAEPAAGGGASFVITLPYA